MLPSCLHNSCDIILEADFAPDAVVKEAYKSLHFYPEYISKVKFVFLSQFLPFTNYRNHKTVGKYLTFKATPRLSTV